MTMSVCLSEDDLVSLAAGQLAADVRLPLELHCARCDACEQALMAILSMHSPVSAEPAAAPPASVVREILHHAARKLWKLESFRRGDRVDRYSILDLIGVGAIGTVFVAWDPKLRRKIALKVVQPEQSHSAVIRSVVHEARTMARLRHPNVVAVYDAGEVDSGAYVAMEFVEGATLAKWLRIGSRSIPEVLAVFSGAARGLAAAHAAGIVHRDFKPANVFVDADGRTLVGDFGLASTEPALPAGSPASGVVVPGREPRDLQSVASAAMTGAGIADVGVAGTPAYLAPELRAGTTADARSDQYSYCVALFEALYGRRPDAPLDPTGPKARKIPRALRRVIERGLHRDPRRRFASMSQLADELVKKPKAKRAVLLAALVVFTALVGAVGHRTYLARKAQACRDAQLLNGAWDDSLRRGGRAAFVAQHAEETWNRVERWLNRYADEWSSSRQRLCELQVRGGVDGKRARAQADCLHEQREQLKSLSDIFTRADAALVDRAPVMALELAPVAMCSNAEAAIRHGSDPALSASLARSRATESAGRYDDALEQLDRLETKARQARLRVYEVQALMGRVRISISTHATAGARDSTLRAIRAAESIGDDYDVARGWTALVIISSWTSSQFDQGMQDAEMARSVIARLGGDDLLTASLEDALGVLHYMRGKHDESLTHLRAALEIVERQKLDELRLASALNNLTLPLISMRRYAEALPYLKASLARYEQVLGAEHPRLSYPLINLANVELGIGDTTGAIVHLRRAIDVSARRFGPESHNVGLAHMILANVLVQEGRYAEAELAARTAAAIFRRENEHNNPYLGGAQYALGEALERQGKGAEGLLAYLAAQKLLSQPDARSAMTGVGRIHLTMGNGNKAREVLERALLMPGDERDAFEIARTKAALARALFSHRPQVQRARALAATARLELARSPLGTYDLRALQGI